MASQEIYDKYERIIKGLMSPDSRPLLNKETFGQFFRSLDSYVQTVFELFLELFFLLGDRIPESERRKALSNSFSAYDASDIKKIISEWVWTSMNKLQNYMLNLHVLYTNLQSI